MREYWLLCCVAQGQLVHKNVNKGYIFFSCLLWKVSCAGSLFQTLGSWIIDLAVCYVLDAYGT